MAEQNQSGSFLQRIFWLLVVLVIICFSLLHYAVSSLQYEETGLRHLVNQSKVYEDEAVQNILVIGSDTRDSEKAGRSDAMMLVSISEHNQTLTVTSLMRDCYVQIPNHGWKKLNAAYAYGGPTLLMDTIEANFHIDVDSYVTIDFFAFIAIVDALGGVEMTLSDAEAEGVNDVLAAELNELLGDARDADYLEHGGTMVLSGKHALAYSRLRYVGNADYERTERQRKVFAAVLEQATRFNPVGWFKLIHDALPLIATNMEKNALFALAMKAPALMTQYEMQTMRIPASGTFTSDRVDVGSVLRVDFDENLKLFKEAVQEPMEAPKENTDK